MHFDPQKALSTNTSALPYFILNSVDLLTAYVDTDYVYQYVNTCYSNWYGAERQEFIGNHVWELLGEEAFYGKIKPHLDACFEGKNVNFESWFSYPNGKKRYLEVSYYPHIVDGKALGAAAVIYDLTDKRLLIGEIQEQNTVLKDSLTELQSTNKMLQNIVSTLPSEQDEARYNALRRASGVLELLFDIIRQSDVDENLQTMAEYVERILLNRERGLDDVLLQRNPGITRSELRVANLIAGGKTSSQIAEMLDRSVKTIDFHRASLRNKLGLKGRGNTLRKCLIKLSAA